MIQLVFHLNCIIDQVVVIEIEIVVMMKIDIIIVTIITTISALPAFA